MKVPMGLIRASAIGPPLVVSFALTLTVLVLLPPAIGLVVFMAGAVALVALAAGWPARIAVPLLMWSRPVTEGELAILAPVLAQLRARGVEPGPVWVRRTAGKAAAPVDVIGGGELVVTRGLVEHLYRGSVSIEEGAALAGHAIGRHRGELTRCEYAVSALLLPWRAVSAVGRGAAVAVGWLPFARVAWTLRGVVGVVCVVQSVAEGRALAGILAGAVIALTYLAPAASRTQRRFLEAAGDAVVVDLGLGSALVALLRRHQAPMSIAREQRLLAQPPAAPSTQRPALRLVRN